MIAAAVQRLVRKTDNAVARAYLTMFRERNALVAYLRTLTDSSLLSAAKFSNPFPAR